MSIELGGEKLGCKSILASSFLFQKIMLSHHHCKCALTSTASIKLVFNLPNKHPLSNVSQSFLFETGLKVLKLQADYLILINHFLLYT